MSSIEAVLKMPTHSIKKWVSGFLFMLLLGFTLLWSKVSLGALWDGDGVKSAAEIVSAFSHPDLSHDFLYRVARLSLESVLIGVLGTVLAVLAGFVLALFAIKLPALPDAPRQAWLIRTLFGSTRFMARLLLSVARAVPAIVWAYLFVRTIGLGPGAAVLAIAVSTTGILGKLYAELGEAASPEPILALERSGARRFSILLFGVLPSVWKQWLGYSLFRFECSIRSASILGVVGAGGLGAEIALSVRYFEYDKLATVLLAVLAFVIVVEILSSILRRSPLSWTLVIAGTASVFALLYLEIPWSQMSLSQLIPPWLYSGGSSDTRAFMVQALWLSGETLAMAWAATVVAAFFAFFLSPFATSAFRLASHSLRSMRPVGVSQKIFWLPFVITRLVFQILRAMPELTLALIFVVWVGPGAFAGFLAICVHTIGVLGRLYTDVYEEAELGSMAALESAGTGRLGVWLFAVFPQALPRLLAFTLYRFEVNVRATAMIGFVGAGGLGDAIHTAISLFHGQDLLMLLALLIAIVILLDQIGEGLRHRILTKRFVGACK